MDDGSLHQHIEDLVAEEERLLHAHENTGLSDAEHQRLESVRVELDRYWDLLRQRRARAEAGLDPDGASLRDAGTVEGYEQ
ncbi:MAG: hypothetical protein QOF77_1071 [Solirubrobacteraceae bacterium]|jgi:hypothetical protein|nr:hypothetical protein [Solirubrobacteraceae bacterium]